MIQHLRVLHQVCPLYFWEGIVWCPCVHLGHWRFHCCAIKQRCCRTWVEGTRLGDITGSWMYLRGKCNLWGCRFWMLMLSRFQVMHNIQCVENGCHSLAAQYQHMKHLCWNGSEWWNQQHTHSLLPLFTKGSAGQSTITRACMLTKHIFSPCVCQYLH